ncbi:hypothetical protein AB4Z25_14500 [Rhizobium sp. RAF36]|uniref:hypothetical protein n=1 Tax=Rhizobium sp. RAF36 TaxID=3233055 RepID=UPI003F95A00E
MRFIVYRVCSILRGLIDRNRRAGRRADQFMLLGSASVDLLKQPGETLAGRIAYLEMQPVDGTEVPADALDTLWLRGGSPDSLLASSDRASMRWRRDFIRTTLNEIFRFSDGAYPPKR